MASALCISASHNAITSSLSLSIFVHEFAHSKAMLTFYSSERYNKKPFLLFISFTPRFYKIKFSSPFERFRPQRMRKNVMENKYNSYLFCSLPPFAWLQLLRFPFFISERIVSGCEVGALVNKSKHSSCEKTIFSQFFRFISS